VYECLYRGIGLLEIPLGKIKVAAISLKDISEQITL